VSAYLEFHLKGNRRAYLDAAMIGGVLTFPDVGLYDLGTSTAPVTILLRTGETIEVIGQSAALILVRAREARDQLKASGKTISVDHLEPLNETPMEK